MTNLQRWNFYTQDLESPQLFIDWTYYGLISAVLRRQVCINGRPDMRQSNLIFPNLFLIFVAGPGVGKSIAMSEAKRVIQSFDGFDKSGKATSLIRLGPSSVTLEALLRYLNLGYTTYNVPKALCGVDGKVYTYASVALMRGEELGTLLREDTHDLVSFLCEGWDCGDFHRETKTQGVDYIRNMCITLLGACTPEWVRENLSSSILSTGLSARTIFVFGPEKRKRQFDIQFSQEQLAALEQVKTHIKNLSQVYGQVIIPPDVMDWCRDWYENKAKPLNPNKKLRDYYERKKIHLMKLAMLIHFADNLSLTLTQNDFDQALDLLARTERDMHIALSGSGSNPAYSLATAIAKFLKDRGHTTYRKLLLEFFDEGDEETIKAALQFLLETKQVATSAASGEMTYSISNDEPDETATTAPA